MGKVVVRFAGICINFTQNHHPQLPVRHRVLVPNVESVFEVWGNKIDSHSASYAFDLHSAETPLSGARLRIANAVGDLTYDHSSYDSTPNLTSLMEGSHRHLGEPALRVLTGENAELASCYFDFDSGRISACQTRGGAAVTVVEVETDGEPLLEIAPFQRKLGDVPQINVAPIPVQSGNVYVSNESDGPGDPNDFLLSYLVAAITPSEAPPIPFAYRMPRCPENQTRKDLKRRDLGDEDMIDIGCSNSTYP